MKLNFNSILLFSETPKELAGFYKKVFGTDPVMEGGGYTTFEVGNGYITIGPHEKVTGKSTNPERIMLNFEIDDVKGEFERIKKLGAKVIAEPYNPSEMNDDSSLIATFTDPDGNIFQLMTPWEEQDLKN